ncbi:hypothetical protein IW261DRAFT_1438264 [Armillaria novae-zelandiae]|uniref:Uncharacterized protein n=1 Tax=Armillaria novae-zelandiae TaxID=153914 RepID=A0AA39PXG3_9AGAR|nr:hypothetical protein IW261DRAFT_1438264 [Armillaria novae-zelandiae]
MPDLSLSRPLTPESPLASSLNHATSTIDDLTVALANFSRVPSPEPSLMMCCCGRDDCENANAWFSMKSKLESRLILSAEVGQALLQRHEAYVRRQGGSETFDLDDREELESKLTALAREKDALEKRLTQALVNSEVTELSNKTLLQELQEAKSTVSRLAAHHARSVGWETRLSSVIKEKDDLQQEREFESQRAKLAESRFSALKEKTLKLQADVRRLQDGLQEKRLNRLESSEYILQEARSQLEVLQQAFGQSNVTDQTEFTKALEFLVDDNESLKRDNAELQHFLSESREEIHALQEEVDEYRANPVPRSGAGTPRTPAFRHHFHSGSMPSSIFREQMSSRPTSSLDRKARRLHLNQDPLTPESHMRPLSPATDSTTANSERWTPLSQPQARYPSTSYQIEIMDENELEPSSPERRKIRKPLLLLSRSRGVQTDPWPIAGLLATSSLVSQRSSSSPLDPRSESSSLSESSSSMGQLIERASTLLNRITQADALTLTNRLKRQNLRGADVSHLSRSTVKNIVSEASALRLQFRVLLEDEKIITTCSRKDLRSLFKLLRDIFIEMGGIRITLNEVILDPSIAPKVSESALNPSKAEAEAEKEREKDSSGSGGWMAPISKLFGSPGNRPENGISSSSFGRSSGGRVPPRPPRFVPKLGPALSASATTVNVEFSGAGVGRAVTSTFSPQPLRSDSIRTTTSAAGQGVMGIFAGAPRTTTPEPWVVLPRGPRRVQSTLRSAASPSAMRTSTSNRLSRNVDAVIDAGTFPRTDDSEEPDFLGPLLDHSLRRRGLSDSSIHSSFIAEEKRTPTASDDYPQESGWPDRNSVLQSLSRKVQTFRMATAPSTSSTSISSVPSATSNRIKRDNSCKGKTPSSQGFGVLMPGLSTWASGGLDPVIATSQPYPVGSPRDESSLLEQPRREDRTFGRRLY